MVTINVQPFLSLKLWFPSSIFLTRVQHLLFCVFCVCIPTMHIFETKIISLLNSNNFAFSFIRLMRTKSNSKLKFMNRFNTIKSNSLDREYCFVHWTILSCWARCIQINYRSTQIFSCFHSSMTTANHITA